jgi:hypothetical protein
MEREIAQLRETPVPVPQALIVMVDMRAPPSPYYTSLIKYKK